MGIAPAGIYIFSVSAIGVACKLEDALNKSPWKTPAGAFVNSSIKYLPPSLVNHISSDITLSRPFCIFSSIKDILAQNFSKVWAHIFIGAAGICVRAIAPFITHKSEDPPVIVIDPRGLYVIGLLSGHWGGANDLAKHLAGVLNAWPIITTASDSADNSKSLDLFIRQSGLKILDWPRLSFFQGRLLRGESIYAYDPCNFLKSENGLEHIVKEEIKYPIIIVDWKKREEDPKCLRLSPPVFSLGFGFRKGVKREELNQAFNILCEQLNITPESIAICATVEQKALDLEARKFVSLLGVNLESIPSQELALIKTPNPSRACGKRFLLPPFSVCESAAVLAAKKIKIPGCEKRPNEIILYVEKTIFVERITMALAMPKVIFDGYTGMDSVLNLKRSEFYSYNI